MLSSREIREKFIRFFQENGHAFIPSAPLIPENDSSVLFTTAGMQPLVPYLLGLPHPLGKRLVNYQKCIRTVDIEEVGDDTHLTFFEMLGNWSLGDYFKEESITYSFEFLTSNKWLGIDPRMLAVTVFGGNESIPRDEESATVWKRLGISTIAYGDMESNWWGPVGDTGPCGPDTEIFYWVGTSDFPREGSNPVTHPHEWVEIWNNVFMEYVKQKDGTYVFSPQKNVDTGMGLERITSVLQKKQSVYETDVFLPIIHAIERACNVSYESHHKRSIRIIADHIRSIVFLLGEGLSPSNVDQGYVLRRLIRRAMKEGYFLSQTMNFLPIIAYEVIQIFSDIYSFHNTEALFQTLQKEEELFSHTLEKGMKEFEHMYRKYSMQNDFLFSGKDAFRLYDTYGFPLEMTKELVEAKGGRVDEQEFFVCFEKHKECSRVGMEKKFQGGLADTSEKTIALHSAAHLMLAGFRKYLGDHVHQAGSNITGERIRFDITHEGKIPDEILRKVEAYVNTAIQEPCRVVSECMTQEEAKKKGIEGSFWEKYPEKVTVYTFIGASGTIYSQELCGGPHVTTTSGMGVFKIVKEESSSKGIRRIRAVLE